MTLYEQLKQLYPELEEKDFCPNGAIVLENNGNGDYIAKWNHPNLPQPKLEE